MLRQGNRCVRLSVRRDGRSASLMEHLDEPGASGRVGFLYDDDAYEDDSVDGAETLLSTVYPGRDTLENQFFTNLQIRVQ